MTSYACMLCYCCWPLRAVLARLHLTVRFGHYTAHTLVVCSLHAGQTRSTLTGNSTALCIQVSDSYSSVQVVTPVRRPAASSHIFPGGLQPASCRPAGLANTTLKDLAVLEQGMIWTGVTQFRLCHNIKHAQYSLQHMLAGCLGSSFNAAQVLVGKNFWPMIRSRCRSFSRMPQVVKCLACLWPAQPQIKPTC